MADDQVPELEEVCPGPDERLESWKEIASYLSRGVRTVIRWEQEEGLPVHRLRHDKRGSVYAYKSELDAWRIRRGSVQPSPGGAGPLSTTETAATPTVRSWRRILVGGLIGLAAGVIGLVLVGRQADSVPRLVPVTRYPGMEKTPAVSPDGVFVAFSWDGLREDNPDIYVKMIDSGDPIRLTNNPARDESPVWSPAGKQIAFVRVNPGGRCEVFVVSALGGAERKLATLSCYPSSFPLRISWTPDGRWILAPHLIADSATALFLISVTNGEMRPLTAPQASFDVSGVVSPDGAHVAFLHSTTRNNWQLHVQAIDNDYHLRGEPRKMGPFRYSTVPPIWSKDSRRIFFLSDTQGAPSMIEAAIDTPEQTRLISGAWVLNWTDAAMSPDERRFVLADGWTDLDIWRFDLTGASRPERFLSSTTADTNPRFSPDGRRVAFSSRRSRSWQIWIGDSDGTNARQLTFLDSPMTGMPRWSPDGRRIAFDAVVGGEAAIWVISAEGGAPYRLTQAPDLGFNPSWSHDGQFVYFCSRRSGREEIWRIPADLPHGAYVGATQVTRNGGFNAFESTNGETLYYAAAGQGGPILRMPAKGGVAVPEVPEQNRQHNLTVSSDGIYFALSDGDQSTQSVWFQPFFGKAKRLLNTGKTGGNGLDVSPDGRWLLCALAERRGGDLWLIERLR